jgi:carbonic anhydrase/acetyltransferase-like protein (isoleucine patch superfamily)
MPLIPFQGDMPTMHPTAWVAPGAQVIGRVTLCEHASVWYNCVLRADVMPIHVGARANIQDGSVVHVTRGRAATEISDDVLVGHMAMVHGCILKPRAFVGLGAIVMDHCIVGEDAMLAAGALLTPGKEIPAGALWAGRPAAFVRVLTPEEIARNRAGAAGYVELAKLHAAS